MTRDEQKTITAFIARVAESGQPPMDVEADAIIRALLVRNPEAAYRLTKLAIRQEAALQKLMAAPAPTPRVTTTNVPVKTASGWLAAILKRDTKREPAEN